MTITKISPSEQHGIKHTEADIEVLYPNLKYKYKQHPIKATIRGLNSKGQSWIVRNIIGTSNGTARVALEGIEETIDLMRKEGLKVIVI